MQPEDLEEFIDDQDLDNGFEFEVEGPPAGFDGEFDDTLVLIQQAPRGPKAAGDEEFDGEFEDGEGEMYRGSLVGTFAIDDSGKFAAKVAGQALQPEDLADFVDDQDLEAGFEFHGEFAGAAEEEF